MPLRMKASCPSFEGATSWMGVKANTELHGPLIVFFWSISCPACTSCFPSAKNWLNEYGHRGLSIIAIHSPRLSSDYDTEQVEEFFLSHNLPISCAIDDKGILRGEFQTENIWPYYFLFDQQGKLRSRAAGGMGFTLFEAAVKRLYSQNQTKLQ